MVIPEDETIANEDVVDPVKVDDQVVTKEDQSVTSEEVQEYRTEIINEVVIKESESGSDMTTMFLLVIVVVLAALIIGLTAYCLYKRRAVSQPIKLSTNSLCNSGAGADG